MKRAAWVVFALALCVVAGVLWRHPRVDGTQPVPVREAGGPPPVRAVSETVGGDSEEPAAAQAPGRPLSGSRDEYSRQFREASDLLVFARSLLPAAQAGDPVAQFYIYRAFDTCKFDIYQFNGKRGIQRPLDEAMNDAAKAGWPFDPEILRRLYSRCGALLETGAAEIGEGDTWLRRATEGGYPVAQVLDVRRRAIDLSRTSSDDPEKREERRQIVAKAVRSRDPDVFWELGDGLHKYATTAADQDPHIESSAWMLVACQRGVDCSPKSRHVRFLCQTDRACQPYETLADLIRRLQQDQYPEIEVRARWISEKIDAGDWESLGF